MFNKSLPMTGFKPWISGVQGDRSTNWATTTAQLKFVYDINSSLKRGIDSLLINLRWLWRWISDI